ncbi:lipopolysaccharide biosynthesis protein [Nostoc linckia z18]|uniref:non-specific protein-tyrosine kinase n=3 Tax=Nostoc linckia TaxID=92942 RepID=A0A9Q5ZC38_NOSLI|nr:lipopolysaccharide biosynthesis protein [Nostoc linckia z1]PHJ67716.1 lipopolysaccharide biosynthesis protein [Nostoc linckia z3]PHJ77248.1 lipopolysaccharide biosynthesis protein [Nostoc linckia z2]PHJ79833.1 lipopolysaccharide biosynthesis protein [Nostoc linckia z4]PHJ87427.1 lipopolysaccharide biosynthesis protein [Nostoc linckia z6]PHJ92049.1 lipopolysaccharide biosynthesis protein [Nostoc linckia z7]PHK01887.1 lipopolysaccharide biosynthesis protein [Nostoc linckia z9]PHK03372.1 lip
MMESKPNFEEIDFQKYLLVLQRRWIPTVGIFTIVTSFATLFAFSLKASYKADGSLLIRTNETSSLTGLGEAIGKLESLTTTNNPLETQAKIVTSVPVLQETIRTLNLKDNQGEPLKIRDFAQKLKIENAKGTEILLISYTDNDPVLTAEVVNQLMKVYIRNNIEANRAEAASARKFIGQEIPTTEAAVKEAESNLRKFKEENKIIALETEASIAVQTISSLEQQISEAQAQFVNVNARAQKLQYQASINSQQSVTFASLSQIPGIQQVVTQLQEAEDQLAIEQSRLQPTHPMIINLEEKITALNNLLQNRINQNIGNNQQIPAENLQIGELRQRLIEDFARTETERVGLAKQITELSNKWYAYKKRVNVLPRLEQTQRQLERKLKAAQTTYEALLTKLQEVQVAENQNIGNARIISPALIPDQSSGPRKLIVIAAGGVLGVIVALIAAFTLDLIDSSVKTLKEARELFQYTLLGVIPSVGRNIKRNYLEQQIPRIIGREIPHHPVGDAYQMLQANLQFLNSDKKLKAIVVTSSVPQEGKSEVAANLAVTMAQLGQRVLLVDANMRHPIQHHIWEITNAVGLSNVMVDQVALNVAIQQPIPNLYVLPSGVVPPNPVALLDSQRMAGLVNSFTQEYDFVIFDTPPLAGMLDAAVLSKLVDGILLVVRPGVINYDTANAAKEFLRQSGQQVLGMVINGMNIKREPDSYFYYSRKSIESNVSRNSLPLK